MSQSPAKTARTLFAWADVNSGTASKGTPLDVSTIFKLAVAIRVGRRTGSAFTAGSPNVRIEASTKASGDNAWIPIFIFQPLIGASIANTTLSAGISATDATFTVTSASNIAAGDILFVGDSSAANYETFRVKSVSSTTITPEDAAVNSHANGAIVTDQAEMAGASLDVEPYLRVRVVVDNVGSGQNISAEVLASTMDSVG